MEQKVKKFDKKVEIHLHKAEFFAPFAFVFALLRLAFLEPYCKKIAVARNTFWQKREAKVERFRPFPTFKAKKLLVNGSISFRFNVVLLIIEEKSFEGAWQ